MTDTPEPIKEPTFTPCMWYKGARTQRYEENGRGLDNSGTSYFEKRGCYKCPGHTEGCTAYIPEEGKVHYSPRGKTYLQ